jgi:UDP-glucuronate decarboxylase
MNPRLPFITAMLAGLGPLKHFFSGKRVLVTGSRGYLGVYVVDSFVEMNKTLEKPCEIIAVDSLITGTSDRSDWRSVPNITFIEQDIKRGVGVVQKLDVILNLAGIASPFWYQKKPLDCISVAVDGSRQMLELAKEHGATYLFTSSSEVYQTASIVPTPETYVGAIPSFNDRSCYDVSKLLGETLAYEYAKLGVDTRVIRVFNSFGSMMAESDRRILPRIASAMRANRKLTVFGREGHLPRRTYTPAANTLLGLFLVLLKGKTGEVYNVGNDSPEVSVPDLLHLIGQVTGLDPRWELVPPPSHYETEPMRRCPDISKLKSLGYRPAMELGAGLAHFFSWALDTYTGAE